MARAAINSSGTKYSLHSNRLPTSSMAGIMYFCTSSLGISFGGQSGLRDFLGLFCVPGQNGIVQFRIVGHLDRSRR